jgi:hypothetical protein
MGQTVGPETSVSNHIKTSGNYKKEDKLYISKNEENLTFSEVETVYSSSLSSSLLLSSEWRNSPYNLVHIRNSFSQTHQHPPETSYPDDQAVYSSATSDNLCTLLRVKQLNLCVIHITPFGAWHFEVAVRYFENLCTLT